MESCETYLIDPAGEVLEVVDLLDFVGDIAQGPIVECARAPVRAVEQDWLRLATAREQLGWTGVR